MTDWKVAAGQVQTVLGNTQKATEPFQGISTSISTAMEWAMKYSQSGPIQTVLGDFANKLTEDMKHVGNQVYGSVNGAVEATKAYVDGQEQMAANAMARTPQAWLVDPPKPPGEEAPPRAPGSTKAI